MKENSTIDLDTKPHWDEKMQSLVVKEDDEWIVSVSPMMLNDRICLTHRNEYPHSYTAGWCYDQGGSAVLAALVWDHTAEPEPAGFKKKAFDLRETP